MPENTPDLPTTIANVMSSLVTEQRKRKKLQFNLILHNAPKSNPNFRKKEDTDFALSVFSYVLSIPTTITNAIRIWKKALAQGFSKPLFNDLRIKLFFITNSSLGGMKLRSGMQSFYNS